MDDKKVLIVSGGYGRESVHQRLPVIRAIGLAATGRDIVGEKINSIAKAKPRKERTEADWQRINAAKAKRERKAAKRLEK